MGKFNWRGWLSRAANSWRRVRNSEAKTPRRSSNSHVKLSLEALECRCLPSSTLTPNQQFVAQVYTDLLQRPVDAGGLSYWSSQLGQGLSRYQFVLDLESTSEYQADLVQEAYLTLLNRPADAGGMAHWLGLLATEPVIAMQASLAASPEFLADAGNNTTGFLTLLYRDAFNQSLDPAGLSTFGGELAAGVSPFFVAYQILSSPEFEQGLVQGDYAQFLHRSVDFAGLSIWSGLLASGASNQQVVADLISSPEYSQRTPEAPAVIVPGGPTAVDTSIYTIGGYAELGSLVQVYSGGNLVGWEQMSGPSSFYSVNVALNENSVNNFSVTETNSFGTQSPANVVPPITQTSTPITVTPPSNLVDDEGDPINGAIQATDVDKTATLTFSASNLPPGLSINAATGVVSGTIAAGDSANSPYMVTVTAAAGGFSASGHFTWTIGLKPTLTTPPQQGNNEGDSVSLQLMATGRAGATLTYGASSLPPGLSIDTSTGLITGTVSKGDAASSPYTVKIGVTDGLDPVYENFTWRIDNGTAPTVTAPPNQTNDEGDTISGGSITAQDTNGAPLTYSASKLPPGLSINPSTGVISGTIDTGDSSGSPYNVTVSASDGVNTGSAMFTWTVGLQPTLTTPTTQANAEGDLVSLQLMASDASGATLTYGASNLPAGLSINHTTGLIGGVISSGAAAGSPYTVEIGVTDGIDPVYSSFTWLIDNATPIVTAVADQTNDEGDSDSGIPVVAHDTNGAPLTYGASNLPPGLSINPSTGVISGMINTGDFKGSPYNVTVSASDGVTTGKATFTWTIGLQPTLMTPTTQANNEGDPVSLQLLASDASGATLTYGASNLPSGLSIDNATGLISGMILTGDAAFSPYTVKIGVTDGVDPIYSSFTWLIDNGTSPTVTVPANQTNDEGDSVSGVAVAAHDTNGAPLTYGASNLPPGLSINPSTGVIGGMINSGDFNGSPYNVTVSASDGVNTGKAQFTWTIGLQPTLMTPTTQGNNEGDSPSLQLVGSDASGATLTYGAQNLPPGLSINNATGLISGTILSGAAAGSPYTVQIGVTDGVDPVYSSFTWLIDNGTSPTVTAPGNQTNVDGDVITNLAVIASDTNSAPLTYSASNLPPGLSINSATGVISGTVTIGDYANSPFSVMVFASDGVNTGSAQFSWTVTS